MISSPVGSSIFRFTCMKLGTMSSARVSAHRNTFSKLRFKICRTIMMMTRALRTT